MPEILRYVPAVVQEVIGLLVVGIEIILDFHICLVAGFPVASNVVVEVLR